jgi:hypothetical protein
MCLVVSLTNMQKMQKGWLSYRLYDRPFLEMLICHCWTNFFHLFSMSIWCDYVSELRPPTGLLFIPRWYISMVSHGGMLLSWYNRRPRRKNLSQCHFIQHKSHITIRERIRASAVKGRRLTTWAMARLNSLTYLFKFFDQSVLRIINGYS